MAEEIYDSFKYRVPKMKLDVYSIDEIKALRTKVGINYKLKRAAMKIQRWWKMNKPSAEGKMQFKDVLFFVSKVTIIQKWWKSQLAMRILILLKNKKINAAKTLQRAFRRHLAAIKTEQKGQMKETFDYFDDMRNRYRHQS